MGGNVQQRLDRKKSRRAACGGASQGFLEETGSIGVSARNSQLRGPNQGGLDGMSI